MDRAATVEVLLLHGQVRRTRDPVIRAQLQRRFDEALAALKRKGMILPPEIRREAERASRSHPIYRQDRR